MVSGLKSLTKTTLRFDFSTENLAKNLNLLTHYAKGTVLHTPAPFTKFQVLFHSLIGVLFIFPSRYSFTIDYRIIFRFRRWSSHIQIYLHEEYPTKCLKNKRLRDYHPLKFSIPTNYSFNLTNHIPITRSLTTT